MQAMIPPGFTIDPVATDNQLESPVVVVEDDALTRKKLLVSSAATTQHQYAAFRGLYVVQSATEARHVRYAMEIVSAELQLHLRITQRYSAFYALRKRLLRSLKKRQDQLARPALSESFLSLDLRPAMLRPCCAGCRDVRRAIMQAPFPKRSLVFTTVDDVDARAPLLEGFLDTCVRLLVDWKGCARGRKFACVVLGKFFSFNLLFHVFQQLRLTIVDPATAHSIAQDKAEAMEQFPAPHECVETQENAQKASNQLAAL